MKNKGITLVALIVTIIVLLILAAVSISMLEKNGVIKRAEEAKQKESESSAREKLEVVLMEANIQKETNDSYNSEEYLTQILEENDMVVSGDTVVVGKYNFLIDREMLIILENLGETQIKVSTEVKEYLGKNANGKYEVSILITVESNIEIQSVIIQDLDKTMFETKTEKTKLAKDMTVELDEEYAIKVTTKDGKIETTKIIEKSQEEIKTVQELIAFRDKVNSGLTYEGKIVVLNGEIDLSSVCYKVNGTTTNDKSWTPIGTSTAEFKGIFNGQGFEIKNLYINTSAGSRAFFHTIGSGGKVENLKLSGTITAGSGSAGLACKNRGTISHYKGNVRVASAGDAIGGVVQANYSIIEDSCNLQSISGKDNVGGICHENRGVIRRCYNKGAISISNLTAGGIAAHNTLSGSIGYICNCYNVASITALNSKYSGGIAGWQAYGCSGVYKGYIYSSYTIGRTNYVGSSANNNGSVVSNCYTTNASSNLANLNNGVDSSAGTNTEQPWVADNTNPKINGGYPILKWQLEE